MWELLIDFADKLTEEQKRLPRIRLYRAIAAEKTDDLDTAEALLNADGGLLIPDTQEGETAITELWFSIEEKKAARDGRPFDADTAKPPKKFDFRMNVEN